MAPDGTPAALNTVVMDPLITARVAYDQEDEQHQLPTRTARATMLRMRKRESAQHLTSLKSHCPALFLNSKCPRRDTVSGRELRMPNFVGIRVESENLRVSLTLRW